jgi:cell division protein FtsL
MHGPKLLTGVEVTEKNMLIEILISTLILLIKIVFLQTRKL